MALALGGTPSTSLTITVWPRGRDQAARVWTLHCKPVGGTLPGAAAACRRLAAYPGTPFAPTPRGTMCTQIYGGSQEAFVRGRFRGRPVWARFDRRDGCAVIRWERVSFLLRIRM